MAATTAAWGNAPPWATGLPGRLHDFVKTVLLRQLVGSGATVCDLLCGRGTDTPKWAAAEIGNYVGIDLSASALEDAEEEWKNLGKPYPASFCQLDPFLSDLESKLEGKGVPFDVVCCLGHLQDCFSSEEKVTQLLENVSSLVKSGGFFFGITADSSTLWSKYQKAVEGALKAGALRFGSIPRVKAELYSITFDDDRFSVFGTKYQLRFMDDGLAPQSQLLVHFPTLIRLAKEAGLEFIEIQNLEEFYDDYRYSFSDVLAETCPNYLDAKGKLMPQIRDVLCLYTTFVFRKADSYSPGRAGSIVDYEMRDPVVLTSDEKKPTVSDKKSLQRNEDEVKQIKKPLFRKDPEEEAKLPLAEVPKQTQSNERRQGDGEKRPLITYSRSHRHRENGNQEKDRRRDDMRKENQDADRRREDDSTLKPGASHEHERKQWDKSQDNRKWRDEYGKSGSPEPQDKCSHEQEDRRRDEEPTHRRDGRSRSRETERRRDEDFFRSVEQDRRRDDGRTRSQEQDKRDFGRSQEQDRHRDCARNRSEEHGKRRDRSQEQDRHRDDWRSRSQQDRLREDRRSEDRHRESRKAGSQEHERQKEGHSEQEDATKRRDGERREKGSRLDDARMDQSEGIDKTTAESAGGERDSSSIRNSEQEQDRNPALEELSRRSAQYAKRDAQQQQQHQQQEIGLQDQFFDYTQQAGVREQADTIMEVEMEPVVPETYAYDLASGVYSQPIQPPAVMVPPQMISYSRRRPQQQQQQQQPPPQQQQWIDPGRNSWPMYPGQTWPPPSDELREAQRRLNEPSILGPGPSPLRIPPPSYRRIEAPPRNFSKDNRSYHRKMGR